MRRVFVLLAVAVLLFVLWLPFYTGGKVAGNQPDLPVPLVDECSIADTGWTVANLKPAYIRDGQIYAIEDHFVFRSEDSGVTFTRLGEFAPPDMSPIRWLKHRIARSKLVRFIRDVNSPKQ